MIDEKPKIEMLATRKRIDERRAKVYTFTILGGLNYYTSLTLIVKFLSGIPLTEYQLVWRSFLLQIFAYLLSVVFELSAFQTSFLLLQVRNVNLLVC